MPSKACLETQLHSVPQTPSAGHRLDIHGLSTPLTRLFGQFYSALQKLNTPQTTKTAQIILFIERVRLPLDCILLEGCGGTTFTDTAQVVVGFPPTCARDVLTHCLTSSVLSSAALFSNNFGWLCRDVTVRKQKYANASLTCTSVSAKTLGQSG